MPKANRDYWKSKLDRNVERDLDIDSSLRMAGWNVLRIWEHEPIHEAVAQVRLYLSSGISSREI